MNFVFMWGYLLHRLYQVCITSIIGYYEPKEYQSYDVTAVKVCGNGSR